MAQTDKNTRLGVERTRLAYERTMMAWVRTGTSLITFGFSIYKFFQIETAAAQRLREGLLGSTNIALLMILMGLAALLIATIEIGRDRKKLQAEFPDIPLSQSLARMFAGLISILGILALIAVALRK
jgi:putative membrane protein